MCVLVVGCGTEPPPAASEQRLSSLPSDVLAVLGEGQRALDEGRYAGGLDAVRRLDTLAPMLPEAAMLHGRLLASIGQRDEAAAAYREALARDSLLEGVRHNLGNLAFEDQRYADAARWYRAEAERFDTPRPWHGLGGAYNALGRADSARLAFEQAIDLAPDYFPARLSLAEWHETSGDFDAALALLEPSLTARFDDLTLAYRVGALRLRTGEPGAAESLLRRVVEAEPWNYGALLALGQSLQQQGDPDAELFFERAAIVREEQALVERLERQVRSAPADLGRRVALGDAYRRTGRHRDALETFRVALGQRPQNAPLLTNVGVLLLQLEAPEDGLAHLQRAVAIDSTFGPAWLNLWMHYGREGDIEQAEAAFARVRRYAPDHPAVRAFEQRRAASGTE
jgi:tetratricopeptide (TPR) repeat protein